MLLLLLFAYSMNAGAQPTTELSEKPAPNWEIRPLIFGLLFSPSLTEHRTSFTVLPGGDACGIYQPASGFTVSADAFALWRIPNLPLWWLGLRVGYRNLGTHLVSTESIRAFRNKFEDDVQFGTMVTRYDLTRDAVELALGAEFTPIDATRIGLAPTITVASQGIASHTDSLVSPKEARFAETDSWLRPQPNGSSIEFNPVVIGLEATVGLSLPMGPRLSAFPMLRGSMSLTSHSSSTAWRTLSFGASLGIGYDIGRRDSIVRPVAVVPQPPARRPYLRATITARGIDENGNEYDDPIIEIEETPWIEVVPVLPYIFFDSASSLIAMRYNQLPSVESSIRFSFDSLLNVGPLDVHWHVLNVIGRRLRDYPDATGTIVGTGSSDEIASGSAVRAARAEAVRRYLTNVWGIGPSRLKTTTRTVPLVPSSEESVEGRAENRRVEFVFDDPRILEPLTIRRLASIASPPAVAFKHEMVSDSAIAEWSISVVQGEKELLRFMGSGDEESLKQDKLWSLADLRINKDLTEIRYRLDVRDVTGQTTAADGRFRVIERKRQSHDDSLVMTPTIVEHFLVGFNYNSSELLAQHRVRLDEIAQTISPDDELLLVGYTDRIGAQERNRQLSFERAQIVYNALRQSRQRDRLPSESAITVRGYGPQEELFDNALPEGRMFSRMVRLVITSYRDD